MQKSCDQSEPVVEHRSQLRDLVRHLAVEQPQLVGPVGGRESVRPHVCPQDWGQPPAEDYCVYKPAHEWRMPAMRTRRDNMIQDALLSSAERWWLERHPDEDFVLICAKSRLSGRVLRFRCRPSDAIVRWVQRDWERRRAIERGGRLDRCTCLERGERCPLCVEAWMGVEDPLEESTDN